jgi:hypothetical protein
MIVHWPTLIVHWPIRPLADRWLAPFAVSDNAQRFVNELVAMISRLSPVSVGPPTPDQGDHGQTFIGVWDNSKATTVVANQRALKSAMACSRDAA